MSYIIREKIVTQLSILNLYLTLKKIFYAQKLNEKGLMKYYSQPFNNNITYKIRYLLLIDLLKT